MSNLTRSPVFLVTGSRDYKNNYAIRKVLEAQVRFPSTPTWVIHGGARGADREAADMIHGDRRPDTPFDGISGLVEIRVPYLASEGKKGGFRRNQIMCEMMLVFRAAGQRVAAAAFFSDSTDPKQDRGTTGMVELLQREDIPVVCYGPGGDILDI